MSRCASGLGCSIVRSIGLPARQQSWLSTGSVRNAQHQLQHQHRASSTHSPQLPSISSSSAATSLTTSIISDGPPDQVVFSGIQPTGVPHLGNYLGAILPWVTLQNTSPPTTRLLYSIVDLHSLTSHQPAAARIRSRRHLLASFLAAGLDPARCTLFFQSAVPAHAELHWILSCAASMSTLARMTQWKSKLSEQGGVAELFSQSANPKNVERLKLGLFSYPVLQAADVLVHRATRVPVGGDQRQHIEFARTCAQNFNYMFGGGGGPWAGKDLLVVPEVVVSEAKRVMSLTEPLKKMSKSHESEKGRVVLTDSDEKIRRKFHSALTDSLTGIWHDRDNRPGVSNLLEIIASLEKRDLASVVAEFKNSRMRTLKSRAADLVIARLSPMRQKFEQLAGEGDGRALDDVAQGGMEKANESANATMRIVRQAVGI